MRREKIANGNICHIYNRGVEKRTVFLDDKDYLRYVHDLFEFNDSEPTINTAYHLAKRTPGGSIEVGLRYIGKQERKPRKLLVDLLAFCLMPNHVHLMVRQRVEGGVTEFMRKLGTGYTNYFNKKRERVGPLFQGKYKFVRVARDEHLLHLPYYIHANPLDIKFPGWRDRKLSDWKRATEFLESYRWSSYQDYVGKKNFPSVTQREFLLNLFGGTRDYKTDMARWLKDMSLETIEGITLE